jgi:pSer/pThr/pTyr-binding forkhead associated (FHA) protein
MNWIKKTSAIILVTIILGSITGDVFAQADRQVILSEPNTSNFPDMVLYFDAIERDGGRMDDLTLDQLTLKENGINREITNFQALSPGIQVVTAINVSPPFAIQDINGVSRFDFIKEGLLNWLDQPLESSPDDLSLITNDGIELTHVSDKDQYRSTVVDYAPSLRETEGNFNVLARAIEIASDPVGQPGMKKVVLFITSQPTTDSENGFDSLLSLASENQVQIYTILVSSPAFFDSSSASRLNNLSLETGGGFYPFSGEEPLVDIGSILNPLRSTFLVEYTSQIVTSGNQSLELTISTSLGDLVAVKQFSLEVLPPNPIFISPPREIIRELPDDETPTDDLLNYQPQKINLDVLIDFPDGHPRRIDELIFRVDGEIIEKKTEPPFDSFEWDLSDYQNTGTHRVSLEAVDLLGLSRKSLETPIKITVEIPPPDLGTIVSNNALPLGGLALVILLGLLLFTFISQGRIRPADPLSKMSFIKRIRSINKTSIIKKVLPYKIKPESQQVKNKDQNFIPYRLIPINDISQNLFPEPLRVKDQEIILGSKNKDNGIHIKHQSVSGDHAVIDLSRSSKHRIRDLGSSGGTWINYKKIADSKPILLQDGDIISIGEVGFRFHIIQKISVESSPQENNK